MNDNEVNSYNKMIDNIKLAAGALHEAGQLATIIRRNVFGTFLTCTADKLKSALDMES